MNVNNEVIAPIVVNVLMRFVTKNVGRSQKKAAQNPYPIIQIWVAGIDGWNEGPKKNRMKYGKAGVNTKIISAKGSPMLSAILWM